jgi:predicted metal-dependent HD superfamily phosphohydrolase
MRARLLGLRGVQEALALLRAKLPADLLYHSYSHTEDVLSEVLRLAILDNLSERNMELLTVAAAWHDVGFCFARNANEPLAAQAAKKALSAAGDYSADEIATIEQMILDTALIADGSTFRQHPNTPLSRYLLDADLANFGRNDFFEKSELQRRELGEEVAPFRAKTLALIKNHSWLSPAAKQLWQTKKDQNVRGLEQQASTGKPPSRG